MHAAKSKRTLAGLGALVAAAAVVACVAQVSTLDRACPCETGWTCCAVDSLCIPPGASCGLSPDASANQCPAGIALSDQGGVGFGPDGAALPFPDSLTMSGVVLGTLPHDGTTVSFDYATSATLEDGGMTLEGWVVIGGGAQTYKVAVWADDGAGRIPLELAAYGPIELGPSDGNCFAPLVGSGPSPIVGDNGTFAPKQWGRYFLAPYHAVDLAANGAVSLQPTGAEYARAYVTFAPPGDGD
jgi:hypothetical protein